MGQMPYNQRFRPKPGSMILWEDLLNQVNQLNVMRYGTEYKVHLGANLALRDVEALIEKAIKYPNDALSPWEWHAGKSKPPGKYYTLAELAEGGAQYGLPAPPGAGDSGIWFRSERVIGTDGDDLFPCVYWRSATQCPDGVWRRKDGEAVEVAFWCCWPKAMPRKR